MNASKGENSNEMVANKAAESHHGVAGMKEESDVIDRKNFGDIYAASLKVKRKPFCKPITVNELYEEILFIILSNTNEANSDDNSGALLEYIREVFEVPKVKHLELLKNAQTKKPLEKALSIDVDRAENLSPMDSNGLSDPFVTVYIESNSTNRYNTAVVPSTLNPSWREHFLIPIQRNPVTEMLIIEVWDFDAAESVGEKMNKLAEVKGIRGFKKLLKEIALTASTGKHDNELIGRTDIPLKSIPATGIKSWYTLKKNTSNKNRGSILLNLYFSTEKSKVISINEHRNLLRIFLLHELKSKNNTPYTWCGEFNPKAETIIKRHYIQSHLSEIECALCQWEVYTKVHETHFLSLKMFNLLSKKLVLEVQEMAESDDCLHKNQFWEGYKKILPSCFVIVRSIRSEKFEQTYGTDNLCAALEIIRKAEPPSVPENVDLFPPQFYGWLGKTQDHIKLNAGIVLREAVKLSASQFLSKVCENSKIPSENTLQHLIIVMRSIIYDIQTAVEFHDKHFYLKSNIKYAAMIYNLYQQNVKTMFFPKIVDSCNKLNQLNVLDEEIITVCDVNDFKSGTLLFDLYLCFKRFTNLGAALCLSADTLQNNKFYECFYPAVANWLNISVIKTLTRIDKAIELDEFHPYNNVMKYTSSALDTLSLFYQIKYFWEQLDWPNIEESYLFVEKIVNDVCRCCTFYANKLSLRIDKLKGKYYIKQNSQDSKEFCYAINDINYIKESLPLFVQELKIEDILNKLAELRSTMEAKRCSATINNIICNTVDIVDNKMFELIEVVAQTFIPMIQKILEEGSDQYKNSERMDQLIKYFQKSVEMFQTELQEENLNKLTGVIYKELSPLMQELIRRELDKYRQPSFFENMHRILNIVLQILNFESYNSTSTDTNLKEICAILKLHAMETEDIIHQYYEDERHNQTLNSENKYGQLSIKANLSNSSLQVHILNAYQLLPMDSENSCNSYVKVHFTPAEKFIGIQSLKTSVQHKTRCPLYDEQFFIKLTPELRQNKNNILVFCVKNKDLFGLSNYFIGECYLSFEDIEKSNNRQLRINLKKPTYSDTDIINILGSRTGDKQAKEFLKKLRHKAFNYYKT